MIEVKENYAELSMNLNNKIEKVKISSMNYIGQNAQLFGEILSELEYNENNYISKFSFTNEDVKKYENIIATKDGSDEGLKAHLAIYLTNAPSLAEVNLVEVKLNEMLIEEKFKEAQLKSLEKLDFEKWTIQEWEDYKIKQEDFKRLEEKWKEREPKNPFDKEEFDRYMSGCPEALKETTIASFYEKWTCHDH